MRNYEEASSFSGRFMQQTKLYNRIRAGIAGGDTVGTWLYAIFWLLLMIGKGLDFESSDFAYKVMVLLAFCFLGIKLITTIWTERELFFAVFFGFAAIVSYLISGRSTLIITVAAILGLKGVNLKKLLFYTFYLRGALFLLVIFFSQIGVFYEDSLDPVNRFNLFREILALITGEGSGWDEIRKGVRHSLGFYSGNIAHQNLFMLFALYLYLNDRMHWSQYVMLFVTNLLFYFLTLSISGFCVITFLLVIRLLLSWKFVQKAVGYLASALYLIVAFFSLLTAMLYTADNFIGTTLDALLTGRIFYAHYVSWRYAIYIYGTTFNGWDQLDNGFLTILWNHGWLLFFAFLILSTCFMLRTVREDRRSECAVCAAVAPYGFMEQFIGSVTLNFSLLFLGELLFSSPTVCYRPKASCMVSPSNYLDVYRMKKNGIKCT